MKVNGWDIAVVERQLLVVLPDNKAVEGATSLVAATERLMGVDPNRATPAEFAQCAFLCRRCQALSVVCFAAARGNALASHSHSHSHLALLLLENKTAGRGQRTGGGCTMTCPHLSQCLRDGCWRPHVLPVLCTLSLSLMCTHTHTHILSLSLFLFLPLPSPGLATLTTYQQYSKMLAEHSVCKCKQCIDRGWH